MSNLAKKFETAAADVKKLSEKPDDDVLLDLYALFKQASAGDCSGPRPGMLDFVGKAKYDAWSGLKGMTKDKAMQGYVDLVEKLKKADAKK